MSHSIQRRWQDSARRKYKGDMKACVPLDCVAGGFADYIQADLLEAGLQMNDYDVAVLHIPYGMSSTHLDGRI